MRHRPINEAQARAVLQILKDECGYIVFDPRDAESFMRAIRTDLGEPHVCHEYRFMGSIGSGGKFRNNGNNNNTPYVDCYRENETPDRLAMIAAANARLVALFKDAP